MDKLAKKYHYFAKIHVYLIVYQLQVRKPNLEDSIKNLKTQEV